MSLDLVKEVFSALPDCGEWHAHLLSFTHSKRQGTTYNCRRIELEPSERVRTLIQDIAAGYVGEGKNKLNKYADVREYDGTCNSTTIYRISENNPDIDIDMEALLQGIADSDSEVDPLSMKAQAYVLCGNMKDGDDKHQIKLISMNTPITTLKNRFLHDKGKFWEIPDKVLNLRTSMNVIIYDKTVYFLDMSGETLFNMERAYKIKCNSTMNRIIKSTVELLLCSNISKQRKKSLRKLMVYFGEVDFIDLHTVNWNVQYNRNNQTYRMLISICYLVVKGLLQTQSDGRKKLMDFLDEQRMCRLYEKFILEYYRKEFKNQIVANASQIPWQLDNEENAMLPVMQSDIMLRRGDRVLIIDAKYYEHSTQVQLDKHTLHSGNLYQIFTYVKNKEYELKDKDHRVSGMLLYAKTDEEIYPNNVYQMSGNQITVSTLDLNKTFAEIAEQLNTIAKTHFDL